MSASQSLKRVLRRATRAVNGPTEAQLASQAQELEHHDRAIHDLFPAVQSAQADQVELRHELVLLQQRTDLLETHLPELLSICSSYTGSSRRMQRQVDELAQRVEASSYDGAALERHAQDIQALWERLEFVRKELMFELRYHGGERVEAEPAEPRVVDAGRVDALSSDGGPRLNLGCGHLPMDGYVNVDMRELPGVDVVAPVDSLPFDDGTVAEVFSAHVLEHFPEEQLKRLLPYWYAKLRPGGVFRAVVPDAVSMIEGFSAGTIPFEDLRAVLYGGQEYEGDFHFTAFSPATLGALLEEAGFVDVEVEASGRVNDISLELQIAGRRPV